MLAKTTFSKVNLRLGILRWALCVTVVLFVGNSFSADPPLNEAEKLVKRALQAELDGLPKLRQSLLDKALELDPTYAPARWHIGQVANKSKKSEQPWLSIEDAEKAGAANLVLAEYVKKRKTITDDASGNEALAKWCQQKGLNELAMLHWGRVLKSQPNHRLALRRLGLKEYQGRWFTRQQIADLKAQKIKAGKLSRKLRPSLSSWRRLFQGNDKLAKEEAARAIKQIANADNVGLLETQLSPHDQKLALAVVDALDGVKEQAGTESLVRHAVLSKWSSVRKEATRNLKDRSPHGYVPILIDAMLSPYEFQSWTVVSPLDDAHVLALNYSVGQRGKHVDHMLEGTVNFLGGPDSGQSDEIREQLQEQIEELNEQREKFNQPIWQTLKETTGQDIDNDPGQWNDWWNDFNEYQVPDFRPVFTSFQRPRSVVVATRPFSCFPAGTLVSTQTGKKPIEKIVVGDYVLSKNAITGELAYKPVLETTVRESDSIVEVVMNGERLLVTRGHPMWVNGRQWQMAKQLRSGDILNGAKGPVRVDSIRAADRSTRVYNLVVSEFHTYFVGESRVLVHDNSLYTPPGVSIPGK